MSNYIGTRCPVCNKKFTADDDIVVCPVCGAPHHRECYAKLGECVFEDEHITGKPWKPTQEDKEEKDKFCINPQDGEKWEGNGLNAKTCNFCGAKNPKDNIFCCSCGNRMTPINPNMQRPRPDVPPAMGNLLNIDPISTIYGGVLPSDKIGETHTAKNVATFVNSSTNYYVPRFKEYAKNDGKYKFDFNFSAFFLGPVYFFYRKMYKFGALLLALIIILTAPKMLQTIETAPTALRNYYGEEFFTSRDIDIDEMIDSQDRQKLQKYQRIANVTNILEVVMRISLGLFANYIYYLSTMKKMDKKYKEYDKTTPGANVIEYESQLRQAGGVSMGSAVMAGIIYSVVSFGIIGVLLYKTYPGLLGGSAGTLM